MPSGRRRKQPERPKPTFFLDRGLGRVLVANAIRERGYEALPMADVYPHGEDQRVPDDVWILRAHDEGWVALTKDYAIIRDHVETLATTTLRVFSLNSANLTGPQMVDRFDQHLNRILQRASKPGPYIYVVTSNGLERRWPPD
jgi:hypothetical protein